MKANLSALITLAILVGCKPSTPPPPAIPEPYSSGDQLVRAMRGRYADRWFSTVTYVEAGTAITGNDTARSVSYTVMMRPDIRRTDYDPIAAGNGFLLRSDTLYRVRNGNLVETAARPNARLLLEFGIYHLDAATTSDRLRRLGFDLTRIRLDSWEGRPVYVVGARGADDLNSAQFWIDRDQHLVVRLIQQASDGSSTDSRWRNYKQVGRAWVATYVEVFEGGRLAAKEEHQRIRIDAPVDTGMFRPDTWSTARHWYNLQ